ncbi:MAG: hypothetical protein WAK17_03135 [Candidatus Nitrosopolaris sp.]
MMISQGYNIFDKANRNLQAVIEAHCQEGMARHDKDGMMANPGYISNIISV